jgi:hypothetical protein
VSLRQSLEAAIAESFVPFVRKLARSGIDGRKLLHEAMGDGVASRTLAWHPRRNMTGSQRGRSGYRRNRRDTWTRMFHTSGEDARREFGGSACRERRAGNSVRTELIKCNASSTCMKGRVPT